MYHHEITLIKRTYTNDGLQDIPKEKRQKVLCKVGSIKRYEFYQMREAGMKPEVVFTIKGYEYDNQDTIEYNSQEYHVVRTFQIDYEEIELVCERLTKNDKEYSA